jgi:hypothetical protein
MRSSSLLHRLSWKLRRRGELALLEAIPDADAALRERFEEAMEEVTLNARTPRNLCPRVDHSGNCGENLRNA